MTAFEQVAEWDAAFPAVRAKYEDIRARGRWIVGPGSTLGVLGLRRVEAVHRDMLRWLLDPSAGHRLGPAVLQRFLAAASITIAADSLTDAHVMCEEPAFDLDSSILGSVDIVIEVGSDAKVLVEIKMWAHETNNQLDRYAAAHEGAHRVFLTPHGTRPSRSPVTGPDWTCLSWRHDIIRLLIDVRDEAQARNQATPALDDYITALQEEVGS